MLVMLNYEEYNPPVVLFVVASQPYIKVKLKSYECS